MFSEYQLQHPEMENALWPLIHAAKEGTLSSGFRHLLTTENLSYKLNFGPDDPLDPHRSLWDTIIGTAAEHRHLDQIPSDILATLVTEVLDDQGTTVLHTAARSGCLNQLPVSALTPENIFRRYDSWGRSPALLAAEHGFFCHISPTLHKTAYVAQPNSCGWTIFHRAAEGGFLDRIPKHLLTVRTMSLQRRDGSTPLHLAAGHCHLGQVPTRAFTLQTLKLRESQGNTLLHIASGTRDSLGYIPRRLLCEENLLQENGQGDTVLHILWRDGDPASVDPRIYTPEILILEGRGGKTLLDYAEEKDALKLIPTEQLHEAYALRNKREWELEKEADAWDDPLEPTPTPNDSVE